MTVEFWQPEDHYVLRPPSQETYKASRADLGEDDTKVWRDLEKVKTS